MFVVSTLDAKFARKMHPVVWKWPQSGPFEAKKKSFLAPNWTNLGPLPHHWVHFSDKFCT